MNAVIYRTSCESWDPFQAEDLYDPGFYLGMQINPHQRVAIFVTRAEEQARWTTAHQAINVTWELHTLHWYQASGQAAARRVGIERASRGRSRCLPGHVEQEIAYHANRQRTKE